MSLLIGALGDHDAHASRGRRERERKEGADQLLCPGRRGDLGGHEEEARDGRVLLIGGGYNALGHCSALQSARLAGMAVSLPL